MSTSLVEGFADVHLAIYTFYATHFMICIKSNDADGCPVPMVHLYSLTLALLYALLLCGCIGVFSSTNVPTKSQFEYEFSLHSRLRLDHSKQTGIIPGM